MTSRRDFIKLASILSGAAGMSGLLPDSIQRAYAIEPAAGSTFEDAEHIVILMQENRSFDHTFGTLRGVRGFDDPRALRLENGNSVLVQTDAKGNSFAPWRLDIRDTKITWMGSLPHSRESQVDAWNEGKHDGWLEAKRAGEKEYAPLPLTMGHYTREDLPFYYEMADAFTVCDQNYCSVMTSTSPNRSYFWTGTIRETQHPEAKAHIRNEQIDPGGLTWTSFPERLQEAGVSWKAYQNELTRSGLSGEHDAWLSNYGDNVLECFSAYNVEAYPGFEKSVQVTIKEMTDRIAKIDAATASGKGPDGQPLPPAMLEKLKGYRQEAEAEIALASKSLANCGEARYSQLTDEQKALHHAAFVVNARDPDYHDLQPLPFEDNGTKHSMDVPKGDVLHQFRQDVEAGKLPTISWLTAPERFSDHPSAPWYGAWYVSEVLDTLTKNPEVWKKTIFILTYDENDGYFDHAPSYVAADPKRPETGGASAGIDTGLEYIYKENEIKMGVSEADARSAPIGMGFRVPMIVASPWTRGGYVNSQLFDHTSTLQFLEAFVLKKYGKTVHEENISPWRRAISGDLTSVFRPYDPKAASLKPLERDPFVISIEKARYREIPANYKQLKPEEIALINTTPAQSEHVPHQEKGTRPACAIPYELYADGALSADGKHFELRMTAANAIHGAKSAGAPFNVYLRNLQSGKGMIPATFAVKAGDTLTRQFPLTLFAESAYAVEVHGPNGFYRAFTGSPASAPIAVSSSYESRGNQPTGNIVVKLRNASSSAAEAVIAENAYEGKKVSVKLHAGEEKSVALDLKASRGWYDFTVKTNGNGRLAQYAGRVETGKPSISDPQMAGVTPGVLSTT
jgi:phospholipase C